MRTLLKEEEELQQEMGHETTFDTQNAKEQQRQQQLQEKQKKTLKEKY